MKSLAAKRWRYVVGISVILGLEFIVRVILLPVPATDTDIQASIAAEWLLLLLLLAFWLPKVEEQSLESIGFRGFKLRYIWLGFLIYLIYVIVSIGSGFIIDSLGLEPIRTLQPMISEYKPVTLLVLFLTGAVAEEVFYRGYLIERLVLLSNRIWLAGFISWLVFSLVHIRFFGIGPTLDVSVFSAFLVFIYIREKNLWPCIILHGINGLFAYLLFPLVIGQ